MKKITVSVVALLILVSSVVPYKHAHATTHNVTGGSNGPSCGGGGYFTPSATTINAGDTITFSVPSNDPYSAGLEIHNFPGGNFTILPGASHTTPALLVSVSYSATWPSSGCQKGFGSVTVQTPPPASAPPPAPTPPPPTASTTSPAPTPPPNKPPDTLKIDRATVDGDKVDTSKNISIDVSKSITLSGYTVANGAVNLTIHSVVRNEIARANASGFWSFTISSLEPGNHTVDATVTDLTSHLTSTSTTLLKFAVTGEKDTTSASKNAAASVSQHKKFSLLPIIIASVFLIAGLAAAIFWFMKRRKPPKKPKEVRPTDAPPPAEIAPTV
jgi:hypothetical protein